MLFKFLQASVLIVIGIFLGQVHWESKSIGSRLTSWVGDIELKGVSKASVSKIPLLSDWNKEKESKKTEPENETDTEGITPSDQEALMNLLK